MQEYKNHIIDNVFLSIDQFLTVFYAFKIKLAF